MRELAGIVTVLLMAGPAALAGDSPLAIGTASILSPFALPVTDDPIGARIIAGERRFGATREEWRPREEVTWRSGALGLGLREENGRVKGGPYLEAGGWRLDLRPLTDANVLDIDGVTLRLSTRFGD